MFKSRFQVAGEALAIAALSAIAAAQSPQAPYQYAHGSRGGAAGVLGSAADGAVASRHADHGADELQAIRTAKDHISRIAASA
jgi:hypothetical protein